MLSWHFCSRGQLTNAIAIATTGCLVPILAASAHTTEVLILSLASMDYVKLNPNKAFQPILHFFSRMSARPHQSLS